VIAQSSEPKKKTLHVTEVTETPDECWACSATIIHVSGFIKGMSAHPTVQYKLQCTEVAYPAQNTAAHPTVCAHVEAAKNMTQNSMSMPSVFGPTGSE